MAVLIIAPNRDEHAQAVRDAIGREGGEAQIFDLANYPDQAALTMRYECCRKTRQAQFTSGDETMDLQRFGSIWWRRAGGPVVSEEVSRHSHRQFAWNEAQEALSGLWQTLDAQWINDPVRDHAASHKGWQLRVAQDCGLRIPATLITSDPAEAVKFIDSRGYRNVIYKSFSSTAEEWRETRLVGEEEMKLISEVKHAPVIFQQYVEAVYDLRITVVDGEIFPAAIYSQDTSYKVDSRIDIVHARIEPVDLPHEVEVALLALMDRMGLVYGAIDMRLTPDRKYVFLEINPAGQFFYIEAATGQPIAAAMASALLKRDAVHAAAA